MISFGKSVLFHLTLGIFITILVVGCANPIGSGETKNDSHTPNPLPTITELSSETIKSTATPGLTNNPPMQPQITHTAQPSHTPQPSFTSTATPKATLSPEESTVRVEELMISNGNCDLPCVWGFIPGGTSEYEIQTFFQKLGWTVTKYNEVDYTGKDFESLMDIDFGFVIQDGILTNLSFGAAGPNYQSIEHAYKLRDVLMELGVPSQIWINLALALEIDEPAYTASDTFLYYHDLGLLLHYGGSAFRVGDGYRFCPTDYLSGNPETPQNQGAVSIQTGIPELNKSPEDLVAPFGLFGGMLPIQQALMIDENKFTQTILDSDQPACFITPIEVWKNLP